MGGMEPMFEDVPDYYCVHTGDSFDCSGAAGQASGQGLFNRAASETGCEDTPAWKPATGDPTAPGATDCDVDCNTDFRYIYPVLLPLLFFSAQVWQRYPRYKLSFLLALGAPMIGATTWIWLFFL
jgi:hypothetical protein